MGGLETTSFLLELLDLMQLAFPHPVRAAEVQFGPRFDQERSVLTDLSGEKDEQSCARPELGYPDEEVLDTINEVVGDLTAAFEVPPAAEGHITMAYEPSPTGGVTISIAGTDTVWLERRMDRSELLRLVHTPTLFAALAETESAEQDQRSGFDERLAAHEAGGEGQSGPMGVELDLEHGLLKLGAAPKRSPLTYRFELLASHHPGSQTFVWGWANESFPAELRGAVDQVRRSAARPGLRAFAAPELVCPRMMAERLAAHAAVKVGASALFGMPVPAGSQEEPASAGPLHLLLGLWPASSDDT